jgi:electron transfer flavoprotein alpha subunit
MPNNILIIAQTHDGNLRKVSFELVTVAREIAKGLGGAVQAVVIGSSVSSCADAMAKSGVSQVYLADDPSLQNFAPKSTRLFLPKLCKGAAHARADRGKRLGQRGERAPRGKLDWGLATDCMHTRSKAAH